MKTIFKNNNGFSILEVLIASAIASMILLTLNIAYSSIVKNVARATAMTEYYENIALAHAKIDKDISNIFFIKTNKKLNFIGETKGENSILNFVTINHKKFAISGNLKKNNPSSDVNEIGYYLKEDTEVQGVYFLVRREQMHYDDEPTEGGIENKILENIISLKFEFKKGNDWTTKWDSRQTKKIPKAVKTTIVARNYNSKKEERFIFISKMALDQ